MLLMHYQISISSGESPQSVLHTHTHTFAHIHTCMNFAATTASTLLERLSTGFRSVFVAVSEHSPRNAFVRSDTDVGHRPGSQSQL